MKKLNTLAKNQKRGLGVLAYALAVLLLVATPTLGEPAEAAWRTDSISGSQNRDSTVYWTTARYMNNNPGVGNAASARVTGWDNPAGIWSFSIGMRSSSGMTGSFASANFSGYGPTYKSLSGANGTVLPRTVFYLTTTLPMTSGGGTQVLRTFYGNIGYSN